MDNGPSAKHRAAILARDKRDLAKKNRQREEKEAATPIVRRPVSTRRKKAKVYKEKPVVQAVKPSPFEYPSYKTGMKAEFYQTREWRSLRWDVLKASDGRCVMCGRGRQHGVIIHVDHIKPRSKFPALELKADNLQVLCEDCNIGKGAKT